MEPLYPGRLGRGSGSTPSLLRGEGTSHKDPRNNPHGNDAHAANASASENERAAWVVITDGATPMRLLVMRASNGEVTGNATVTFAPAPPKQHSPTQSQKEDSNNRRQDDEAPNPQNNPGWQSTSEQSVVVRPDGKAVVVQNWLPADRVPLWCRWFSPWLPDKAQPACPFLLGAMPLPGVQQLAINLASGRVESSPWQRTDVQCASSIPAADSDAFYCLGMRPRERPRRDSARVSSDGGNATQSTSRRWLRGLFRWPWERLLMLLEPRNEFVVFFCGLQST